MNTLSILITLLAIPIGRILLQHYLRDVGTVFGDTLAALAGKQIDDARARGQLERSFQEIAEQICERLAPLFIDAHSTGVAVEAVASEVKATLCVPASAKLFVGIGLLGYLRNDLDPVRITSELKQARPLPGATFSAAEVALYDRALDETVRYIIEVSASLPEFRPAAARESLQRLRQIQRGIDETLDTVQRIERSIVKYADPNTRFEADYRQAVVRNLDYVELFGVDLSDEARRHALSVAYISLRLTPMSHSLSEDDDLPPQSAEEVLGGLGAVSGRLLLRGHAGAGKSTLLRWIAIEAAKGGRAVRKEAPIGAPQDPARLTEESDEAIVEWRSRIPFVVRLRDCDSGRLPSPDGLPMTVANEIGHPPGDWVQRALSEGRGIVLLDGVDEVPHVHHEQLRKAVSALVGAYPKCFFVISTRPTAVPPEWLRADGFREARIDTMFGSDIEMFVKRWHQAVAERLRQYGRPGQELDGMASELLAKLSENPAISRLANNPLLCAMICALHRERNRELPESRASLCDALCLMLLHRRDRESGLHSETAPGAYYALGLEHKRALVERLAEHMLLNGLSSVAFDVAEQQIAAELRQFPSHGTASAVEVRTGLINRSGMLRESRRGHLDFLHNTLKEYLAAGRFVDRGDIGLLSKNALDPPWREVVLFAVATTRHDTVATDLIQHLLDSGESVQLPDSSFQTEPHRSRALFALRCRNMAFRLAPELHERLDKIAAALFPPQSIDEAEALAAAGEAAVPYLRYVTKAPAKQTAACARTLRLIGTRAAKKALLAYGEDERSSVAVEVAQVFPAVSLPSVQRRIFDGVYQTQSIAALVKDLTPLTGRSDITKLCLTGTSVTDFTPLGTLTALKTLELRHARRVLNFDWLASVPSLEWLNLNMTQIEDLGPLLGLSFLRYLSLWGTRVKELAPISNLTSLELLRLSGTPVSDLAPLTRLVSLVYLDLGSTKVNDVGYLAPLIALKSLGLHNTRVTEVEPLRAMTALRELDLGRTLVNDLIPIANLAGLERLEIGGTKVTDLQQLACFASLRSLGIASTAVTDLRPLTRLESLSSLDIAATPVSDLSPLLELRSLRTLMIMRDAPRDVLIRLEAKGVTIHKRDTPVWGTWAPAPFDHTAFGRAAQHGVAPDVASLRG